MSILEDWEAILAPAISVASAEIPGAYQPSLENLWHAFSAVGRPRDVRLVIIGQDPYHTPGMATGIAFGIPKDTTKIPPSLRNIMTKYSVADVTLEEWATRGVLLLNTALTVEIGKAGSHRKLWHKVMAAVVKNLSQEAARQGRSLHFVLWGRNAMDLFRSTPQYNHTHCVSSHPSPLSCNRQLGNFPPFKLKCNIHQCPCAALFPPDSTNKTAKMPLKGIADDPPRVTLPARTNDLGVSPIN
ncbi:MAG: uracil-DNA glycosylase [Rubritalea sp.]|uniref:uracil-DNA glycosylase n=1 Tax=Rubritalea sp. TaxID=2109375 RepID=UPI00324228C1